MTEFLLTGLGAPGVELLHRLLSGHPRLHLSAGRDLVAGAARLADRALRQSKHPDRPWDADAPGVAEVCDHFLRVTMAVDHRGRLLPVTAAGDADVAYLGRLGEAARVLPGLRLVIAIDDGRTGLPEAPDEVRVAARTWAARLRTLELDLPDVPVATVDLARARAAPAEVRAELYGFLGLDPELAPELPPLPPPGRAPTPAQDAAFRSVPEAEEALQALGWAAGPSPGSAAEPDPGEPGTDTLAAEGPPGLDALLAALAEREEPHLLVQLFDQGPRPEARPYLARARRHPDPQVRGALARWLVASGLDREAAEALTLVHRTRWYASG